MTDKQVIIDGVDVSGCLFYQTNFEEDYDVKIKHYCSNWCNSCESDNNSNCYYKQLKHKEQKLDKITTICEKETIVSPYIDDFTGYNEKLGGFDIVLCVKELLQQLDQLKKIITTRDKIFKRKN